ncbi:MAG TPA: L-threonate dehydrogenase [Geminicoccaceae bacterium]|nr:L-threonate dehydrogenase [Geminicoccaceae bacterium]
MRSMQNIGFIGLGAMGAGMAANLLRAGFAVTGFDLRQDTLERLVEQGGTGAASPRAAAEGAALLILMVVNDAQVEAVLFGAEGALETLPPGATVVLSSTVPAGYVRDLGERLAARGFELLDAPVSGGAIGAERGQLTVMASGSPAAFAAAEAALEVCARQMHRLGEAPGIGSTVKAVNQLLAGINLVTAAEGMAFGAALGADPKVLYEVIRNAAGGSWMFENRVPHMLDDDYSPRSAVDIWVKDLGLVLDTGRTLKMPLPMAAAAYQVVMMAAAQGLGPIDDAGFVKVYESFTGAKVAGPDDRDKRG